VALRLTLDSQPWDRVGKHHQLATVHSQQDDIRIDVVGGLAERSVRDGTWPLSDDRDLTDSFRGHPTRTEEGGDITVVCDIAQRGKAVRHTPDAAVTVVFCDRRERGLPGSNPENTARCDTSSAAIFCRLAHRGTKARNSFRALRAEGDADRGRSEM
jgi:hypothetical protein